MFISKQDKQGIFARITVLEARVETLARSLNAVLDIKTTASDPKQIVSREISKQAKAIAKRNAYARAYYQKKKAEKAKEQA